MKRATVLLVAVISVLAAAGPVSTARADATIGPTEITNSYPTEIVFSVTATAPVEITDASLRYTVVGTGVGALGKPDPEDFTPGTSVSTRVIVTTNPNTDWIPVGNVLEWYWEFTLADGTVTTGPASPYLYLPPDKEWQTAEGTHAVVYYTGPRAGLASNMLEAIDETYETHGVQLLKTELDPDVKVTVLILATSDEIEEAQPSEGTTRDDDEFVVTCGFRPNNLMRLIFGTVSCGGSDPVDTIRHEFAHVLNAAAGQGTLVDLPVWLEEGLAVYAQEDPGGFLDAFEVAARRGTLLPFREMILPVADPNDTILQYGQSYAMTFYLIDTYGVPKLNELLDRTKANTRFDVALEETYGFDLDGFEEEFLAAVNGPAPTAQPTQQRQPSQPTVEPTRSQPQPDSPTEPPSTSGQVASTGDDNFDRIMVALVGGAIVLMLAAVMAFLLMMFMQNQRSGGA